MARPRIYDEPRVATAIRLPISLRSELVTQATKRDVSVNYLITRAISTYLAGLGPFEAAVADEQCQSWVRVEDGAVS